MLEKRGSAGKIISFCVLSRYVPFTDRIVSFGAGGLGHFLPRWLGHFVGFFKKVVFTISSSIVKELIFFLLQQNFSLGFRTE